VILRRIAARRFSDMAVFAPEVVQRLIGIHITAAMVFLESDRAILHHVLRSLPPPVPPINWLSSWQQLELVKQFQYPLKAPNEYL
jgi:hypothetical protein